MSYPILVSKVYFDFFLFLIFRYYFIVMIYLFVLCNSLLCCSFSKVYLHYHVRIYDTRIYALNLLKTRDCEAVRITDSQLNLLPSQVLSGHRSVSVRRLPPFLIRFGRRNEVAAAGDREVRSSSSWFPCSEASCSWY